MALKLDDSSVLPYIRNAQFGQFLREHRHVHSKWSRRIAGPIDTGSYTFYTPMLGILRYKDIKDAYANAIDCVVLEGVDIVIFGPKGSRCHTITVAEGVRMSKKGHGHGIAKKWKPKKVPPS